VGVVTDPPDPEPDPEPEPDPDPDPDPLPPDPVDPEAESSLTGFTVSAAPPPQALIKNSPTATRHEVRTAAEVLCSDMLQTIADGPSVHHRRQITTPHLATKEFMKGSKVRAVRERGRETVLPAAFWDGYFFGWLKL
jgi:hypothetical protein